MFDTHIHLTLEQDKILCAEAYTRLRNSSNFVILYIRNCVIKEIHYDIEILCIYGSPPEEISLGL